jgi:hypothetical protein
VNLGRDVLLTDLMWPLVHEIKPRVVILDMRAVPDLEYRLSHQPRSGHERKVNPSLGTHDQQSWDRLDLGIDRRHRVEYIGPAPAAVEWRRIPRA